MKKILQSNWNRYKNDPEGQKVIAMFEKVTSADSTYEDIHNLAKKFNPQFFSNESKKEYDFHLSMFKHFDEALSNVLTEDNYPQTPNDCIDFFCALSSALVTNENFNTIEDVPQNYFKDILSINTHLSMMLYAHLPMFFIPNLFAMQFIYLKKIAQKYEIELPDVPHRKDYRDRWLYYLDMNIAFYNFAIENAIQSTAELCAFLYDYELQMVKEEIENEEDQSIPEITGQAWILVGNYAPGEKDMKSGFWQANEFTEKGDILLFYEKSPIKSLNSVWIAQQDGMVDPFFQYYSNTYMGNKISIPADKALTFEDFKNNEYFKNRDKKGNFVSKNFQDVSGWPVTYEDYEEIKRMLSAKGYDTSTLPKLYEPVKIGDVEIKLEKDVSEQLLIPLLEQMGWKKDVDFKGEIEFNAGRGKTGYSMDKRPDFCLHYKETADDVEAKVAIEVKKFMKNNEEVHQNFVQGRSYAKWGAVQVLVLCDMRQILVYKRNKDNKFDESKPIKYSWLDMENPDKYNELKKILS